MLLWTYPQIPEEDCLVSNWSHQLELYLNFLLLDLLTILYQVKFSQEIEQNSNFSYPIY